MNKFQKNIQNSLKFNLFKLARLPLAYIAGLRVVEIDDKHAKVRIKYGYWTKNPFRSMYFAAQAMAAELSTGALVMDQIAQQRQKISMLVLQMEAKFTKKAVGKIYFTCEDGHLIDEAIQQTLQTGEGQTIQLKTVGKNEQDEIVSTFSFTWTLKVK